MKWYRIRAIVLRHVIQIPRDFGRLSTLLYWPIVDMFIFGFTTVWLKDMGVMSSQLETIVLSGIILWQIVVRANLDISGSLLEEIWSHNMNNLFAAPLMITEWICAVVILASIMTILSACYVGLCAWFFYSFSLLSLGIVLVPTFISVLFSGIFMGFFASSFLVYYGARVQTLVYMMGYIFMPLSGISYSLDILPAFVQRIAYALPMSYTFEMVRMYVMQEVIVWQLFSRAMLLNGIYCGLSLIFFVSAFEKSRSKGLSRLVD